MGTGWWSRIDDARIDDGGPDVDAITLLKQDHKLVKSLFRDFQRAKKESDRAGRQRIATQVIEELSVHAAIEEGIFYPAVRAEVEDSDEDILEALEEHHLMKWTLDELSHLDPSDERFDPKMTVLMEVVRHHVEEEESSLFPTVRSELGRKRLAEVGDQLEQAKSSAPREPLATEQRR
jgi:hemerythrin superfamily protein